jgi:GNAT superfamily N-acetyltransferase
MNEIILFSELNQNEKENAVTYVREIFFLSSSVKSFRDEEHKNSFFEKWCGDYLKFYSEHFMLMRDSSSKRLLGYLSGCPQSEKALEVLRVPGMRVFEDLFINYPAHLHINFHPSTRGLGLGSHLIKAYINKLRDSNCHGVHLVTSTDASNINFYLRLGFVDQNVRLHGDTELLFMGQKLDRNG